MSQLNFYRLSILFFALVTIVSPMSRAAALQIQRHNNPNIKEEIYQSFKTACDKIQDEQSCQEQAKGRDCRWIDGKCQCVPEQIAIDSTLNTAGMVLIGMVSALTGLFMLIHKDCGSRACEPYKTYVGGALVLLSALMFNGARLVKADYEALHR